MIFYSFNFFIDNKTTGHHYEYLKGLNKSFEINKYKYVNFVPKNCDVNEKYFLKALFGHSFSFKKNLWYQIFLPFRNFKLFFSLLKKIKSKKTRQTVFFIDGFVLGHLMCILMALLLIRPSIKICIFHRYDPSERFFKGRIHFIIHKLYEILIGKYNLFLFTDTEPLATNCMHCYKKKVHILPISHTENSYTFSNEEICSQKKRFSCWWPGIIREEKGIDYIKDILSKLNKKKNNLKIIMSGAGKNFFPIKNHNIEFLEYSITRDEYYEIMNKTDFILLPYLKENYYSRSSGVFVEAIVFGKIVLTTEGTWMAYELKKFNLDELITDWQMENIANKFHQIIKNKEIIKKIKYMQNYYKKFHSIENFAKTLKSII